jgi:hypothetical protein
MIHLRTYLSEWNIYIFKMGRYLGLLPGEWYMRVLT